MGAESDSFWSSVDRLVAEPSGIPQTSVAQQPRAYDSGARVSPARAELVMYPATGGTRSANVLVGTAGQVVDLAKSLKRESLALREALISTQDSGSSSIRADGDVGMLRTDRDRLEALARLEALTPYFGIEITSEKDAGISHVRGAKVLSVSRARTPLKNKGLPVVASERLYASGGTGKVEPADGRDTRSAVCFDSTTLERHIPEPLTWKPGRATQNSPPQRSSHTGSPVDRSSSLGAFASPVAAAGIHVGDIIVGIDGQACESARDFQRLIQGRTPGDMMEFVVVQNGRRTVLVEVGALEAQQAEVATVRPRRLRVAIASAHAGILWPFGHPQCERPQQYRSSLAGHSGAESRVSLHPACATAA